MVATAIAAASAVVVWAAAGDLDPSFGSAGQATNPLLFAYEVARQPDGNIIVAGVTTRSLVPGIIRFTPNGTSDTTFGAEGLATDFGGVVDRLSAIAVQGDGKIVSAGQANPLGGGQFAVARHNAHGTLDSTFGDGGVVVTAFGAAAMATGVAIQSDGKIVVAGSNAERETILVRYTSTGSVDTTFGTTGSVITPLSNGWARIAIQSGDKILAAGTKDGHFAVVRYHSDGTLDETFGGTGLVTTTIGSASSPSSIITQSDGKIVLVGCAFGEAGEDFALVRYNPTGTLDTMFGSGGMITTDFGRQECAYAVAVDPGGKIVAIGISFVCCGGDIADMAVARYNANGSPDIFFGNGGRVVMVRPAGHSSGVGVVIQADRKIVSVRQSSSGTEVFRYKGVSTPAEKITTIANLVVTFNLQHGLENSLDAKLQNALDALEAAKAGDVTSACRKLGAFVNEVQAQSGNALTADQATQLIGAATEIANDLGCS